MNIDVKNSIKLVDYRKSMEILEQRVNDIHNQKKNELLYDNLFQEAASRSAHREHHGPVAACGIHQCWDSQLCTAHSGRSVPCHV